MKKFFFLAALAIVAISASAATTETFPSKYPSAIEGKLTKFPAPAWPQASKLPAWPKLPKYPAWPTVPVTFCPCS